MTGEITGLGLGLGLGLDLGLGLGLDINRVGVYMLSFSDPVSLPEELLRLCKRYTNLGQEIARLSILVTESREARLSTVNG